MLILAMLGCSQPDPLVLAAASTEPPVEALLADATARRSYASTATLVRQLDAGVHAAILIGANEVWTEAVPGVRRATFATNRLVVLGGEWEALAEAPCVAMGDPEHVPGGRYAKEALMRAGLWSAVEPAIVPTLDAPAAVRAVHSGACAMGIAYATDAERAGLDGRPVPDGPVVTYPIVQLGEDAQSAALFETLTGEGAVATLAEHGFTSP